MRIAVAGAGAMGCRFGWQLAQAGADVLLLDDWPQHVDAIRAVGLRVIDDIGEHVVALSARQLAAGQPGVTALFAADLFLVFGKSMQTSRIMASLAPALGADTTVLTLQNGLGNVEVIERYVRRERIIAGTTTFTAELLGPGRIRALGTGTTDLMGLGDSADPVLGELVELMARAGLNVRISADVMTTIWSKVAFNCVLNALCTLLRVPVGALPRYPRLDQVVTPIVDEVVAVAASQNVVLERGHILHTIQQQYDPAVASDHLPSMLVDTLQGRDTEVAYLNGAVARIGAAAGLAVPANQMLAHLLSMEQATRGERIESLDALVRWAACRSVRSLAG